MLSSQVEVKPLFTFLEKTPGYIFTTAEPHADAGVVLVVKGRVGEEASVTFGPSIDPPDGMLVLSLQPSTVLLPGGVFGLEVADGIALDDTADAAPPGQTILEGQSVTTAADTPAWRGTAVQRARLFLPQGVPFLGRHAVDACAVRCSYALAFRLIERLARYAPLFSFLRNSCRPSAASFRCISS